MQYLFLRDDLDSLVSIIVAVYKALIMIGIRINLRKEIEAIIQLKRAVKCRCVSIELNIITFEQPVTPCLQVQHTPKIKVITH